MRLLTPMCLAEADTWGSPAPQKALEAKRKTLYRIDGLAARKLRHLGVGPPAQHSSRLTAQLPFVDSSSCGALESCGADEALGWHQYPEGTG